MRDIAVPVEGRGWRGIRRVGVDEASCELTPGELQQFGGWVDIATPLGVYREKRPAEGA